MNVITLVGRAGRDPEIRYFESGTMVANLSLAVDAYKKDEEPDWFNLVIWGKQAQVAADYVRKGKQIAVSGRSSTEKWTDKTTGEQRSKPVVIVERITLLGSKNDGQQDPFSDAPGGPAAPTPQARPATSAWAGAAPAPAPQARPATPTSPPVWGSSAGGDDSDVPF
jgi:single-strand DNA-binding protein